MKKRIEELHVSSLSAKGNGMAAVAVPQGTVNVEIPFTMPGDIIQVEVGPKRQARLLEIVTPSPARIKPRCVHFGVCGGCRLQHLDYLNQLKHKEQVIHKCFAALITPSVETKPTVPAPAHWQYRNKMEYTFSQDAAGKKYLGLIIDSSGGKVLNLVECHLTDHWFIEALKTVKEWWEESGIAAYHMHKNSGSLRTLTLREGQRTGDRMVILTVSGNPEFALSKEQLEEFVAFVRDAIEPTDPMKQLSIVLRIHQAKKGMPTQIYEMVLYGEDHIREILYIDHGKEMTTLKFHVSPSAFFQPNSVQAEKIYSQAIKLAAISKNSVVYDLYCGTGALGLCVSGHVKEVIGIELSPESSLDARENAKRNGCENMTVFTGDVRKVLQEEKLPKPDAIFVDPPRTGLDPKAIKQLIEIGAPKIIYISCNPITQAANIAELMQHGYRMKAMQAVDQFPQTYHIENIVLLELDH